MKNWNCEELACLVVQLELLLGLGLALVVQLLLDVQLHVLLVLLTQVHGDYMLQGGLFLFQGDVLLMQGGVLLEQGHVLLLDQGGVLQGLLLQGVELVIHLICNVEVN